LPAIVREGITFANKTDRCMQTLPFGPLRRSLSCFVTIIFLKGFTMFRTKILIACCLGVMMLAQTNVASAGMIWNAYADLGSSNPSNTVWTYGWANSSTSAAFDLYQDLNEVEPTYVGGANMLMRWQQSSTSDPCIVKNFSSSPITVAPWGNNGVEFKTNKLFMYGGPATAVLSFTAPTDGSYSVAANITQTEFTGTVGVVKNMTTVGSGATLSSSSLQQGDTFSYSQVLSLSTGETISFFNTGNGVDLTATISQVPEPTSFALITTGIFGILAYAWRKRK
jgi:hypothetical protein